MGRAGRWRPSEGTTLGERHREQKWVRWEWVTLGAILAVAVFLRFFRLDVLPPGLHYDEAAYGMLATEMLQSGQPQIFFRAYAAREPFFVYLVAASIVALGHIPLALHLVAATVSSLTVLFTYLFGRLAFGRPAALLGSGLLAVSYWHVHTGRLAFRAITVPLMMAVTAWLLWAALRRNDVRWYAVAGLAAGVTFYTYIPARFLAILVPAFFLWQFLVNRGWWREHRRGLGVFCAVAVAVFVPLGVHYLRFPEDLFVRFDQSSVFTAGDGNALSSLVTNLLNTLGMFSFKGDVSFKYNLPGRPVFAWPAAGLFYLGTLVALARLRRPAHSFLLLWMAAFLLPGALTVESPHFLRTLGVAPPTHLLPAIGLLWAWDWLSRVWSRLGSWTRAPYALASLSVLWVGWTGVSTYRSYFDDWGRTSQAFYAMEGDVAAAAQYVATLPPGGRLYFAAEHYRHPSVAFLAGPAFDRLKWFDGREVLPLQPGATYIFPQQERPPEVSRFFPSGSLLAEGEGPDGQPAFAAYRLPPGPLRLEPQQELSANLGGAVDLLGYGFANQPQPGENLETVLYWRVRSHPTGSLQFSLQLVDGSGRRWGQRDPGSYLSDEWEPGETVVSWAKVPVDPTAPPGTYYLEFSLYDRQTLQALPVLDGTGRPQGQRVRSVAVQVPRRIDPLPASALPIQHRAPAALAEGVHFLGYNQRPDRLRAGGKLYATLFWQATSVPGRDYEPLLQLVGEDGRVWQEQAAPPAGGVLPTSSWRIGETLRDERELIIGGRLPPDTYHLRLALRDPAGAPVASPVVLLGSVQVEGRERSFAVPAMGRDRPAQLGEVADLLGYDLPAARLAAGKRLELTLYWRARGETDTGYKVFVHLLDGTNRIWGQQDAVPGGGALPTTSWVSGEVVADHYSFDVDAGAPPGRYWLEVGMYDPASGRRLPVPGEDGDRVLLAEVEVAR